MILTEIETLTKKYEILHHDVNEMRQGISNLQKSMQRIEHCLLSDAEIGHEGLVKKYKDLSVRLECTEGTIEIMNTATKTNKAVKDFKASVYGVLGGIGIVLLKYILDYFSK